MAHIEELPVELLGYILSFFANARDQAGLNKEEGEDGYNVYEDGLLNDLCKACLVSRRFRELAQSLLFRYFFDETWDGDHNRTIYFARAIYHRPELGNHVREIGIAPIEHGPNSDAFIAAEDCDLFKRAIQDLQLGDEEQAWISAMEDSDLGVFVALLVNKTPNLRLLDMPGNSTFLEPFVPLFSRNPSFLSSLDSFCIQGEYSGYNIASYQDFLTLPKLDYPMFGSGDLAEASFPSTWAPRTLATERVQFDDCLIDAGSIRRFMQACKKLTSFSYQNFCLFQRYGRISDVTEFNAAQVQEAALLHKDSLEFFHVELERDQWNIANIEEYISSHVKVGSFRDFSVLRSITIQQAFLPPHPEFPHSLKNLRITDCVSSIRDMADNIAEDCENGLYPELTDFKVLAFDIAEVIKFPGKRVPRGPYMEHCLDSLREFFKRTKVEFRIESYRRPGYDDYDLGLGYEQDHEEELDYEEDDEDYGLGEGPLWMNHSPDPELFNMLVARALQDPDIAHLRQPLRGAVHELLSFRPDTGVDDPWETDDGE